MPLPYSQLRSPAWRSLGGAAVRVWLELHTRFNGSNNGTVRLSYAEAAEALGIGKATAQRAFQNLQDKGFLVLEKEGNWYHRQAHEWRLTTKPTNGPKGRASPTNEWLQWRPENLESGSVVEPSVNRVVPFQNPKQPIGSKPKPVRPKIHSGNGSSSEH
ncbi:MAG: helix-turn-helix domain-containing protein [Paracoccaceae bacterium]|nr:helix-turn-helix domain-containing protein [Paracoccaceae bacterium]